MEKHMEILLTMLIFQRPPLARIFFTGNAPVAYKIFSYLVYSDLVKFNVTPDASLYPNLAFCLSTLLPLESAIVLKKVSCQSDISGSLLWNLLGHYDYVLQTNEDLKCNEKNECHLVFVSIKLFIIIFIISYFFCSVSQNISFFSQQVLHTLHQPMHQG
jgi:hypothetical protein